MADEPENAISATNVPSPAAISGHLDSLFREYR